MGGGATVLFRANSRIGEPFWGQFGGYTRIREFESLTSILSFDDVDCSRQFIIGT